MRIAVIVTTGTALALVPVTLLALSRPAPRPIERIVYVPLIDASSTCLATWKANL